MWKWTVVPLIISLASVAGAQDHHHHPPQPVTPSSASLAIRDALVQTHDGRTVRFHSDLVKGRVVAINFLFTSCTTVCPVMGVRFAQLRKLLVGKDVTLISVSIDPTNDTPERLAAWAKRIGAKPGWTLVTGPKPEISALLASLGASAADPAAHTPLVLIGDERRGSWRRVDGLADSKKLAKIVEETLKESARAVE